MIRQRYLGSHAYLTSGSLACKYSPAIAEHNLERQNAMQKKMKIASGAAVALALALVGGITLTAGAQATPAAPDSANSSVEPTTSTDTDNVQDEVEDGTADGETADDTGTESATETGTESDTEDTTDDINGAAVEDGTQD